MLSTTVPSPQLDGVVMNTRLKRMTVTVQKIDIEDVHIFFSSKCEYKSEQILIKQMLAPVLGLYDQNLKRQLLVKRHMHPKRKTNFSSYNFQIRSYESV